MLPSVFLDQAGRFETESESTGFRDVLVGPDQRGVCESRRKQRCARQSGRHGDRSRTTRVNRRLHTSTVPGTGLTTRRRNVFSFHIVLVGFFNFSGVFASRVSYSTFATRMCSLISASCTVKVMRRHETEFTNASGESLKRVCF